ncbi:XRE family transcriptional regulator [Streptomyces sp. GESEQ-35]|uniref:helix-turn-helix domain-containing protein n=1 Tax=Streptomyces sp. GESEQ-35 TaxID=2812657 RepID=UPI001B31D8F5|nr:XRE family transcriptional regulator [Streptomyces sp. GESEQ-35]
MTAPTPSPERARLAAALRELRARTSLSMAGLAAKTTFSKSSWERYLNGRALPPREAVQELCRLAGEPDSRCLALWEIAESEGSGRATTRAVGAGSVAVSAAGTRSRVPSLDTAQVPSRTAPAGSPPVVAPPDPPVATRAGNRRAAAVAALAAVCAVTVGGIAVTLLLLPHPGGEPRSPGSAAPYATGPECRGSACEGKNPVDTACAVLPVTLAQHQLAGGARLQVRYSRPCGTSWGRMWGTRVGDRLELTADDRVREAEIRDAVDLDSFVYTPMTVTGPGTALRICFRPAAGSSPPQEECFSSVSPW